MSKVHLLVLGLLLNFWAHFVRSYDRAGANRRLYWLVALGALQCDLKRRHLLVVRAIKNFKSIQDWRLVLHLRVVCSSLLNQALVWVGIAWKVELDASFLLCKLCIHSLVMNVAREDIQVECTTLTLDSAGSNSCRHVKLFCIWNSEGLRTLRFNLMWNCGRQI